MDLTHAYVLIKYKHHPWQLGLFCRRCQHCICHPCDGCVVVVLFAMEPSSMRSFPCPCWFVFLLKRINCGGNDSGHCSGVRCPWLFLPHPPFPPPSVLCLTSVCFVVNSASTAAPRPSSLSAPTQPSPIRYLSASLITSKAWYSMVTLLELLLLLPLPQSTNQYVSSHQTKMANHSSMAPSIPLAPPSVTMMLLLGGADALPSHDDIVVEGGQNHARP